MGAFGLVRNSFNWNNHSAMRNIFAICIFCPECLRYIVSLRLPGAPLQLQLNYALFNFRLKKTKSRLPYQMVESMHRKHARSRTFQFIGDQLIDLVFYCFSQAIGEFNESSLFGRQLSYLNHYRKKNTHREKRDARCRN